MILPPKYQLTRLIITEEHQHLLHSGGQLLLSSLHQHYWIVNGKDIKRLGSRRGRVSQIYSVNVSNFIRGNKDLHELKFLFETTDHQAVVNAFTSKEGIQWPFIPPRAPHLGGLWEAGIKSFKYHLRRVMRPLTPLSNDPNDPSVLTPDITTSSLSLLSTWQWIQQQLQQFWNRWSADYLSQLQQRNKWTTETSNIQPDNLVILRKDSLPPLMWKIGIIQQAHPGPGGLTRVVTIRTTQTTVKRSITKLCPLPNSEWCWSLEGWRARQQREVPETLTAQHSLLPGQCRAGISCNGIYVTYPDHPWCSRLVRRWSRMREALGSNPRPFCRASSNRSSKFLTPAFVYLTIVRSLLAERWATRTSNCSNISYLFRYDTLMKENPIGYEHMDPQLLVVDCSPPPKDNKE
ncbi:hypothetical protein PR048_028762 [Dryococelus australis]|uniref:DUF5641 domain-containing protein n=1 Tax=Dryococelus australis TaxID=614101 RepID=A0ABQ9GBG3_9NEOP|nr:hypothetical protein PR048_028762 [Dryococelus australis]